MVCFEQEKLSENNYNKQVKKHYLLRRQVFVEVRGILSETSVITTDKDNRMVCE